MANGPVFIFQDSCDNPHPTPTPGIVLQDEVFGRCFRSQEQNEWN